MLFSPFSCSFSVFSISLSLCVCVCVCWWVGESWLKFLLFNQSFCLWMLQPSKSCSKTSHSKLPTYHYVYTSEHWKTFSNVYSLWFHIFDKLIRDNILPWSVLVLTRDCVYSDAWSSWLHGCRLIFYFEWTTETCTVSCTTHCTEWKDEVDDDKQWKWKTTNIIKYIKRMKEWKERLLRKNFYCKTISPDVSLHQGERIQCYISAHYKL